MAASFLSLFAFVGAIFAIFPAHYFENRFWQKHLTIISAMIIIVLITGIGHVIYTQTNILMLYVNVDSILQMSDVAIMILINLSIILPLLNQRKYWQFLLKHFFLFHEKFIKVNRYCYLKIQFLIILWSITFSLTAGFTFYSISKAPLPDFHLPLYFIEMYLLCFRALFFKLFLYYFMATVARQYKLLETAILGQYYQRNEIIKDVIILERLIICFNKTCGWSVLLIYAMIIIKFLYCINNVIGNYFFDISIVSLYFIIQTVVLPIFIVWKCEEILQIKYKIAFHCSLMINTAQKKDFTRDYKQIVRLMEAGQKFSAANFFDIDRKSLLAILGSITNYVVVLIQLRSM